MEQILKLAQHCFILSSAMLILNGALYPLNWFAAFARNICGLRKKMRLVVQSPSSCENGYDNRKKYKCVMFNHKI